MTFASTALSRIKLRPGKPVSQHDKPRLRPAARPTNHVPLSLLRQRAEAAAFQLRGFKFGGAK